MVELQSDNNKEDVMVLEPLYAENIIVAVIYNNKFKWYVTDKELWFLDYNKLDSVYKNLGISIEDNNEPEERVGLKVLDNENVVTILNEEFENDKTGEKVQELTKWCSERI